MENLLFIAIIVVKSVFDYYEQFALESIFLHQLHIPTSFVSKKFNSVERKAPFCIYGHKNWVDQFLYNIEVKGENLHLKFAYIYALLNAIPIRYSKLNSFNFPYLFKSRAILSSSQIMSLPEL